MKNFKNNTFLTVFAYIQTFYKNFSEITPPKYPFKAILPIFYFSISKSFNFSIATIYSYSFGAWTNTSKFYGLSHPFVLNFREFLRHFMSLESEFNKLDSNLFNYPNLKFFDFTPFFPIYYFYTLQRFSFVKNINSDKTWNYIQYYFLPFYFSPFSIFFWRFFNSFFSKFSFKINLTFFILFVAKFSYIFFLPLFSFLFFFFKILHVFFEFFNRIFNFFFFFLQTFVTKVFAFLGVQHWATEITASLYEYLRFRDAEDIEISNSMLNLTIVPSENVKYEEIYHEPDAAHEYEALLFLAQLDLLGFKIFSKFFKNFNFAPIFTISHQEAYKYFSKLNKRLSIFIYGLNALPILRGELFPKTQAEKEETWLFNHLLEDTRRKYPFETFPFIIEHIYSQILYYSARIALNLLNLDKFIKIFFFSYFRKFVIKNLRVAIISMFFEENQKIFRNSAALLSFEKPYLYAPYQEFYTIKNIFQSGIEFFFVPYRPKNFSFQFFYKLIALYFLEKKIYISFSAYLQAKNFLKTNISDPLFLIFTDYYIFNFFFPIFSYLGFDYIHDKNIFRDVHLTDNNSEQKLEDLLFNFSGSSEFATQKDEDINFKTEMTLSPDLTFFNQYSFDSNFPIYENFSHFTYFFGYYTDFFFKFIFWPKIINQKVQIFETYYLFQNYFNTSLKRNLFISFFYKFVYFDIIYNTFSFFRGFFSFWFSSFVFYPSNQGFKYIKFFRFVFSPILKNFQNFYNAFFFYTKTEDLVDEQNYLTDEERAFDLGHNSEDYIYGLDVDRYQIEEDIATDYTNHLLEQHFYSTYVDEEDFFFDEFDAFDAYVFDEEFYNPTFLDDELQMAIDFSYEDEFGIFFDAFEEAQYLDLDENFYEYILETLESFFFFFQNKDEAFGTFYLSDDWRIESSDVAATENLIEELSPEDTEDATVTFTDQKNLLVLKNYTTAYNDYFTKWLTLNKPMYEKYKKLPPFLYGLGRYTANGVTFDANYKNLIFSSNSWDKITFNQPFLKISNSKIFFNEILKANSLSYTFFSTRFKDPVFNQFFFQTTNMFNLPIYLFPKDPYLASFVLAQTFQNFFSMSILETQHFSNPTIIKFEKSFIGEIIDKFTDKILVNLFDIDRINNVTRLREANFGANQISPVLPSLVLVLRFFSYLIERFVFRNKNASVYGGNEFFPPLNQNIINRIEMPSDTPSPSERFPRIDEWEIYQTPSIIDLPARYGTDPLETFWYSIYFNKQLKKYDRLNKHFWRTKITDIEDLDLVRPQVYIRSINKIVYEDDVYSYSKRLRRRLYEIRKSQNYPFIKDGFRVVELLRGRVRPSMSNFYTSASQAAKVKTLNEFADPFTFYSTKRDWTFHPEFKSYQALSQYLDPEFTQLIVPDLPNILKNRFKFFELFFNRKNFEFSPYKIRNFFRRKFKKNRLLAIMLFSSFNKFSGFSNDNNIYRHSKNFETFYYVRTPDFKNVEQFSDFDDLDESPYIFFSFFSNIFPSFQYYRIIDTFFFPYQYTFPFGNFFYDHEVFDLDEDETQEFSSFDFYVLEEPDSEAAVDTPEILENESGVYSELVDISYDDEFDDTASLYDLEKDFDNSTISDLHPFLGTSLIDTAVPETGSENADTMQSAPPFDPFFYDDTRTLNQFIEFDEGYYNVLRPEFHESVLLEELVCQLYEKYINILEIYPVDFFPPKTFNWHELEHSKSLLNHMKKFSHPRRIDDIFNEFKPSGQKFSDPIQKYYWNSSANSNIRSEHLKIKIKNFNRKKDRHLLHILKNLQTKYATRYPKTLDPYYFRRFELFLDNFFNLPEFSSGRYFNIFKIYTFSISISEKDIFEWIEDSNLEWHELGLPDAFENLDFENDTLDPDAFEFWAETSTSIARFFFGYARTSNFGTSASDARIFFSDKINLSTTNYKISSIPFSSASTALMPLFSNDKNFSNYNFILTLFSKLGFYIFLFLKTFLVWWYYYFILLRPEMQLHITMNQALYSHFWKNDRYYSNFYFQKIYIFLSNWDENFKLDSAAYPFIEHEYLASLCNPIAYSNTRTQTVFGKNSSYFAKLFSYLSDNDFEYYFEDFFVENHLFASLQFRNFNSAHFQTNLNPLNSPFSNIINTFFFWNYDEFFYEELHQMFDETSYDENLATTNSPIYTSDFLPEDSIDESIDFVPFIEELYQIDPNEFETRVSIILEFFFDTFSIYTTIFVDYSISVFILFRTSVSAIFVFYDQIWLNLLIRYGFMTIVVRSIFSISFFIIFLFYGCFVVPYLVFFYFPFTNYFLTFFFISFSLFFILTSLMYTFFQFFKNFFKTLTTFEFEVFFFSLCFCWFEHVYWGYHIFPVNTTEPFDNPLFNSTAEDEVYAPYQTLHYRRLNEKTYNTYFMAPLFIHTNLRQHRQTLRSFIFSYRVKPYEVYEAKFNKKKRLVIPYTKDQNPLDLKNKVNFYPNTDDLFVNGDARIRRFFRWSNFDDVLYIDFLNRGSFYALTFEDFKKIFWETFLPFMKPYYIHQTPRRHLKVDKDYLYLIRSYQSKFALSFGNNNVKKFTRRSRKLSNRGRKLKKLPGRLYTPFHKLQKFYPRAYRISRKRVVKAVGPVEKLLQPNIFPHHKVLRKRRRIQKKRVRQFNRYNPFYNLSQFNGSRRQFRYARDTYSPFAYSIAKFIRFNHFRITPFTQIFNNRSNYNHFSKFFTPNSPQSIDYYRSTGGMFARHHSSKKYIRAYSNYIFNRSTFRQPDQNYFLQSKPVLNNFFESTQAYENTINFAANQHIKKALIAKFPYYNQYRVGAYGHSASRSKLNSKFSPFNAAFFTPSMRFALDFKLIYYQPRTTVFSNFLYYTSRSDFVFSGIRERIYGDDWQRFLRNHTFEFLRLKKNKNPFLEKFYDGNFSINSAACAYLFVRSKFPILKKNLLPQAIKGANGKRRDNTVFYRYLGGAKSYFLNRKLIKSNPYYKYPLSIFQKFQLSAYQLRRRLFSPHSPRTANAHVPPGLRKHKSFAARKTVKQYKERLIRFNLKLMFRYPNLLEPNMLNELMRPPFFSTTPSTFEGFYHTLLIKYARTRNSLAEHNFKVYKNEKLRLDFNKFVYNKKDFFSRFSFYNVSPIYTINSPLSKMLIMDFFGFKPVSTSNDIIVPVTDPLFYVFAHRTFPTSTIFKSPKFLNFNNLYSTKNNFYYLGLNMLKIDKNIDYRPNNAKIQIFKQNNDVIRYHRAFFKSADRYVRHAFNMYNAIPTSETFFIRGPREYLAKQYLSPKLHKSFFGLISTMQGPSEQDFERYENWSVNINSRIIQNYFQNESYKYEFFTRNIMYDSPYTKAILQESPPNYVKRKWKKRIRNLYKYPFYQTVTRYRNSGKFAVRRPDSLRRKKRRKHKVSKTVFKKKRKILRVIYLNKRYLRHVLGASRKRRWETMFHRRQRANAFRAFFEYPANFNRPRKLPPNFSSITKFNRKSIKTKR